MQCMRADQSTSKRSRPPPEYLLLRPACFVPCHTQQRCRRHLHPSGVWQVTQAMQRETGPRAAHAAQLLLLTHYQQHAAAARWPCTSAQAVSTGQDAVSHSHHDSTVDKLRTPYTHQSRKPSTPTQSRLPDDDACHALAMQTWRSGPAAAPQRCPRVHTKPCSTAAPGLYGA